MSYEFEEAIEKVNNTYDKYFNTYIKFSGLKADYEKVKNSIGYDYKIIKKQRDNAKFNLLKLHTSIEEKIKKLNSIYSKLQDVEKQQYYKDYEKAIKTYSDLKSGAISYRINLNVPIYSKRSIKIYNKKI